MGAQNAKPLPVPGKYIIVKTENGIKKEQYAYVSECIDGYYHYTYGFINSHEGSASRKNIRELTKEEKTLELKGQTHLPQGFYQSF
jgi:hypothetical protein